MAVSGQRDVLAQEFVDATEWRGASCVFLAGDSSVRTYDRLTLNGKTAVLMNAPLDEASAVCKPGMTEAERSALGYFAARRLGGARVDAFVCIGEWLRAQGASVPQVYAYDAPNGFAIIEDFGDSQYWGLLEQSTQDELTMYQAATDALVALDAVSPPKELQYRDLSWPLFTYDQLARDTEAGLFVDWYAEKHMGLTITPEMRGSYLQAFRSMYSAIDAGVAGMILRDYHSPNLMWLPARQGWQRAGMLDYQDNVAGHPAFNLMFLLNDARRIVSPNVATAMKDRYFVGRGFDTAQREAFMAAYHVYLAINYTRVSSWPLRMKYSYSKPQYMVHLPRIIAYLQAALQHPACAPLRNWFNTYLPDFLKDAA